MTDNKNQYEGTGVAYFTDETTGEVWWNAKYVQQLQKENEEYKNSIVANLDRKLSKRCEELLDENEDLVRKLRIQVERNTEDILSCTKLMKKLEKIREMVFEQKTSKFYTAILDDILELIDGDNDE